MKKSVSPVIVTVLFLLVAIVSITGFSGWFTKYSSSLQETIETEDSLNAFQIKQLIGNQLYVYNSEDKEISLESIKIGDKVCSVNQNLSKGMNSIWLNTCLDDIEPGTSKEITIISSGNLKSVKTTIRNKPEKAVVDLDFSSKFPEELSFRRNSTATYFAKNGTLVEAEANEARIAYDPHTRERKGLLIEGSSTNYLTNNINLSNWIQHGNDPNRTLTYDKDDVTEAPDGSMSADRFINDGQNRDDFGLFREFDDENTNYTFSLWMKEDSLDRATIFIKNLQSDTIIAHKNVTLRENWQRFNVTGETNGNKSGVRVEISSAGRDGAFYVWGMQLEKSLFPTSYIPTNGSEATTREGDTVSLNDTSWAHTNSFSIYSEHILKAQHPDVANSLYNLYNTTTGDFYRLVASTFNNNQQRYFGMINGTQVFSFWPGNEETGNIVKLFIKHKGNSVTGAYDNQQLYQVNTSSLLKDPDTFQIGATTADNYPLNGYLRRLIIWDYPVSDAEMQKAVD